MYGHKSTERVFLESFQYYYDHPRANVLQKGLIVKRADAITDGVVMLSENAGALAVPYMDIQQHFRGQYGKEGAQLPLIGHHPDFEHLKEQAGHEYAGVVTMFMDIEGSTKLGLHYALEEVFKIKNAFIQTAIAIIRAFDGHVHRIMGDAVMAFFGGRNSDPDRDIINGMNCAAQIMHFVKRVVMPRLESDFDDTFGIRIGLDYGPSDKVLWSAYGFPGVEEVTATSFYVDVAAKLQHSAGRNRIMIGQSLRLKIDFPNELVSIKEYQKGGEVFKDYYIEPNYITKDGSPHNYRKYVLEWEDYLRYAPENTYLLKPAGGQPNVLPVHVEAYDKKHGTLLHGYHSCAIPLPKGIWLKFTPVIPKVLGTFRVRCEVENHGEDAKLRAGDNYGNHHETYILETEREKTSFSHWEHTGYRGLHYLHVEGRDDHGHSYRTNVGIYVA